MNINPDSKIVNDNSSSLTYSNINDENLLCPYAYVVYCKQCVPQQILIVSMEQPYFKHDFCVVPPTINTQTSYHEHALKDEKLTSTQSRFIEYVNTYCISQNVSCINCKTVIGVQITSLDQANMELADKNLLLPDKISIVTVRVDQNLLI